MRGLRNAMIAVLALSSGAAAVAAETVTYSYDALGRLKQASTSGGADNGLTSALNYDPADNRSSYTISGSPRSGTGERVVVVPLNGLTVIPLPPLVQ
jgi:hypothetical protein